MKATVFLGGGRITAALIAGLRLAGYRKPIVVHDRHPEKLRQLKRRYDIVAESDLRKAVEAARILIIAVRPPSVRELIREIATFGIHHSMIAVSLAAGVPLSRLRSNLKPPTVWARAMPSPVCRTGHGLTALAFDRALPASGRNEVRALFSLVGDVLDLPENRFDAFTVTFSSSHGYHALAALIAAAEAIGLDRASARIASAHALADGISYWREGRGPLDQLLGEAATPGGIAASVMTEMNRLGYKRIVERGLRAGMNQARKNRKR